MAYRILTHIAELTSTAYYRSVLPAMHLKEDLAAHGVELVASTKLDEGEHYDAYIFGRVPDPRTYMFAMKMKRRGAKIIWDIDDDFLALPHWEPFASMFTPVSIRYLEESLMMSDYVTVSTPRLSTATSEGWYFLDKKDVFVLDNLIDVMSYFKTCTNSPSNITKILWTGSHTHIGDMGPLDAVVEAIQAVPGFILIMYGYMPKNFLGKANIVHMPWAQNWNYAAILSLIAPDISLIPLLDSPFNRSKSAIKFFETTMAGGLCMASDTPPFCDVIADQITGLLLSHDKADEWIDEIKSYRDSQEAAAEMRLNARREVTDSYSWNVDNPRKRAWRDFMLMLRG